MRDCFTWLSLVSLCGLLTILERMSLSRNAHRVILHSKIGWRKLKTCWFGSRKRFWLCIIAQCVWRLGKGTEQSQKKNSVIRRIWLLVTVSDWSIIMIGPGGLLLVFRHLFAVPVSVLWVGLQKSKLLNLDVKKYFCSITCWAHSWRSSKVTPTRIVNKHNPIY
jgi:hypothetical protein